MLTYDQVLIAVTAVALFLTGIVMLAGTFWHFSNTLSDPNWTVEASFNAYTRTMNYAVLPFVLATLIALGLCIPRRFLTDKGLIIISGLMVVVSGGTAAVLGAQAGLALFMGAAVILQLAVLVLHFSRSTRLNFLSKKRTVRLGSLLGHLGILIFVLDITLVKDMTTHVQVFWVAFTLIVVGFFLMFYPDAFRRRTRGRPRISDQA